MFSVSEDRLLEWVSSALLVFFRIGGALMVAPMFGALYVPVRVRLLLALALSLAVLPILSDWSSAISVFSPEGVLVAISQIMLGMAVGFLLQLMFEAVTVGIQTVSMGMGLGFAVLIDNQSGIQIPTLSQLYMLLTMLIFLALDGHLAFLGLLIESFRHLPVDSIGIAAADFRELVLWGTEMFAGAARIALPAATAGLIANISIGVISRAAPQLNLFAIGLPFTMLVGILVLMLSLPAMHDAFIALSRTALSQVARMLGAG